MSNPIEFGEIEPVMPEFLEEVSKQSSDLLNCRLVNKIWCSHCQTALRKLWNDLQKNSPKGMLDIPLSMRKINSVVENSPIFITNELNYSYVIRFKKLAYLFVKLGAILPAPSLPCRITDFQLLQETVTLFQ